MIKLSAKDWICIGLIIAMFALNFFMYSQMPDKITTHWNAFGTADGWMAKGFWSVYLIPLVGLVCYGLFLLIPKIMVFKKNLFIKYDILKRLFK